MAVSAAGIMLPAATLTWRELQRFVRQRSRIVGALGTPVIFWLLIGSGLGRSFSMGAGGGPETYLEYFFPGTFALILLFTAIFNSISTIEDRHEGFLQGVLASPASRISIALGKILGSTLLASAQGLVFLLLAPFAGISLGLTQLLVVVAVTVLVAFGLAGLGFLAAWKFDSMQGFHSVMNLVLFPMWILSGALFPAEGASVWLRWLLQVNPLTYGLACLRHALYPADSGWLASGPEWSTALLVTAAFGALMFGLSVVLVSRPSDS